MNHQELLQAASDAQPKTMEKVAAMVFLTERLDSGIAAEAAEAFRAILDRASSGMEKVSAISPRAAVGLSVAGSVLGALGTAISADLYDSAKKHLTASRNFSNILKANPELEQSFQKTDLRRAFSSLHRFGPEFTADPILGGQLLFAATRSPESLPMLMKDLTGTRKNIVDTKLKQFSPRFTAAEAYQQARDHADHKAEQEAAKKLERDEKESVRQVSREYADILNRIRPKVTRTLKYEPSSQVYHRKD